MSAEAELAPVGEDTLNNEEKARSDDVEAPKDEAAEIEAIKESEGWLFPKIKVRS